MKAPVRAPSSLASLSLVGRNVASVRVLACPCKFRCIFGVETLDAHVPSSTNQGRPALTLCKTALTHAKSFTSTSQALLQRRNYRLPTSTTSIYQKQAFSTASTSSVVVPYSSLTVGIPRETFPNERRVAITPQNVALLLKKGFSRVLIEAGAGAEAQFTDDAYRKAGAIIVDKDVVWSQSDVLLKVRAPSIGDGPNNEVKSMREGATVISFLYPAQNKPVVDALAAQGVTSFAMDKIPRISRAQVFDALRLVFASKFHSLRFLNLLTSNVLIVVPWQTLPDTRLS